MAAKRVLMRNVNLYFSMTKGVLSVASIADDPKDDNNYTARFTGNDARTFMNIRWPKIQAAFPGNPVELLVNGTQIVAG